MTRVRFLFKGVIAEAWLDEARHWVGPDEMVPALNAQFPPELYPDDPDAQLEAAAARLAGDVVEA